MSKLRSRVGLVILFLLVASPVVLASESDHEPAPKSALVNLWFQALDAIEQFVLTSEAEGEPVPETAPSGNPSDVESEFGVIVDPNG